MILQRQLVYQWSYWMQACTHVLYKHWTTILLIVILIVIVINTVIVILVLVVVGLLVVVVTYFIEPTKQISSGPADSLLIKIPFFWY